MEVKSKTNLYIKIKELPLPPLRMSKLLKLFLKFESIADTSNERNTDIQL